MKSEPDYYAILGVGRDATQADINSAYRRLVRQHHPDTTSAAESPATLEQVMAAYAVLRDPQRRAEYDRRYDRRQQPKPSPRAHANPSTPPDPRMTNMTIRVGPVRFHGRRPPEKPQR